MREENGQVASVVNIAWPLSRIGEAIEVVAKRAGLSILQVDIPEADPHLCGDALDSWLTTCGAILGTTIEPVPVPHSEVIQKIRSLNPLLIRIPFERNGEKYFLPILRTTSRRAIIVGPDHTLHRISLHDLRSILCSTVEERLREETLRLLERAGVPARHQKKAAQRLIASRLYNYPMEGLWHITPSSGNQFRHTLRTRGALGIAILLSGIHLTRVFFWLASWWVLGNGALKGRIDSGWLWAWGLLLITTIPLRAAETWLQGKLSMIVGGALKGRLLVGALKMNVDTMRKEGYGRLLGRVYESQAIESLAFSGGISSVMALVELFTALGILLAGAGGVFHAGLLLCWIVLIGFLLQRFYNKLGNWTEGRLEIAHDLVETMTGHRTRLAQERPEDRHRQEDQLAADYLERSAAMDRIRILLETIGTRGWLVVGMVGLIPAFLKGNNSEGLALGIGGVLLARSALETFRIGVAQIAEAGIAWHSIAPIFKQAARTEEAGHPHLLNSILSSASATEVKAPLIDARNLTYRYSAEGKSVLRECSIAVASGERVLLEGASGEGKSTLAALLSGLRDPESGLLLLQGLDGTTLGEGEWRKRIAAAPQFHENHVLIGTFAFNLLMGRRWPPRREDIAEGLAVCRQLGLEDVLSRMPSGMDQMVGETGWQLSHGERSRLYIARALLQGSELILLDESFGALDPETLRSVVQCVAERAPTLLTIAHP